MFADRPKNSENSKANRIETMKGPGGIWTNLLGGSKKNSEENSEEQQTRKAAKAALKKADRFWRLAEKAPNESYREQHMKQAKDASTVSAEKTRQADEIRAKGA
jgi:hypothetical protein